MKVMRKYYIGIQRNDEVIYVRDSVLLKSGPRRKDLPFVARVSGFWEEAEGKAIMFAKLFSWEQNIETKIFRSTTNI